MDLETLQPRVAACVGILALVPTLWYAVGRPSTAGLVAAVNVLIILTALWVSMQPIDHEENGHGATTTQ